MGHIAFLYLPSFVYEVFFKAIAEFMSSKPRSPDRWCVQVRLSEWKQITEKNLNVCDLAKERVQ